MIKSNTRKHIQNVAIIVLMLAGIRNIISSFPFRFVVFINRYYHHLNPYSYYIHGMLSFVVGILMLILARRLYKRMFFAWVIELIALSISIILHILKHNLLLTPMAIIELIILLILILNYKDFRHKSEKLTIKWGIILAFSSLVILLLNSAINLFLLKRHFNDINNFNDAIYQSFKLLFFMDTSAIHFATRFGKYFADSIIVLNWGCIIFAFLVILKPLVYNPIITKLDKEKVKKLVHLYSENAMSYLSLENDKKYYFGQSVEGVVSFAVISDVAVCCGDIICSDENSMLFLTEFMLFCKQNGWSIALANVTDRFLDLYKKAGFGCVKIGEDAMFKLSEYNLKGGRVAKVRAAINHANNAGITVGEYKPLTNRDHKIEKEMHHIAKLWLASKRSDELSFMMGSIGLENPMDRRYFIARDKDCKMLGFIIFLPYNHGLCYAEDVTRRLPDAPQGVFEKIIYDAFTKFKSEGIEWVNLGLIPLANVREDDKTLIAGKLLDFIYENLNGIYGFKALHHYKKKYDPTEWQTRYLVYYPALFTPKIVYAIVKVQNPKGLLNMLTSPFRK